MMMRSICWPLDLSPKQNKMFVRCVVRVVCVVCAWRPFAFAETWNSVIDGLRQGDLVNDDEKYLLAFRFIAESEQDACSQC